MNRVSFRMVLFVLALSAAHMAAMGPVANTSLHRLQPETSTNARPSAPAHVYGSLHMDGR